MKTKRFPLYLAIFITFLSPLAASGSGDTPSVARTVNGKISYLEGEVRINGKAAKIGDLVKNSDTLETLAGSFCEVVFEDDNVFKLDELTITKIDWTHSDIRLSRGGISAVFNKLDKLLNDMKDFTVTSPSTVAGVRGTVFYARVEDKNNTYVCICNGELAMEYGKSELDISATHHKAYRFTSSGNEVTWTDAPMLYHDDSSMNAVASQIGYTIPWGESKEYSY